MARGTHAGAFGFFHRKKEIPSRAFVTATVWCVPFFGTVGLFNPELFIGMLHPWVGQIRLKRNGFKTLFTS